MKKLYLSTALGIAMGLSACGGGSGDTSSPDPTPAPPSGGSDNSNDVAASVSGKIIDGYVQGATIYLDLNGNLQLDDGEPNTVSEEGGDYRLDLINSEYDCYDYVPIVVDVPVGAMDEDLGEVEEAYQMVLPPFIDNGIQGANITPLTTILWDTFRDAFLLDESVDLENSDLVCENIKENFELISQFKDHVEQSIYDIVQHYNISEETIYGDFIESGDTEAYELAQTIVKGLKKGLAEAQQLQEEYPDSYVDVKFLKTDDNGWVKRQYIWTPATGEDANGWATGLSVESTTWLVSSDLEQLGPRINYRNRNGATKVIDGDTVEIATSETECEQSEFLSIYSTGNSGREYEVSNEADSCNNVKSKDVFAIDWTDADARLGHISKVTVKYDEEAGSYPILDSLEDFYTDRNNFNYASIKSDLDVHTFHYDDSLTNIEGLLEQFALISLEKYVEENGLRVEYTRVLTQIDGWAYRIKSWNDDDTYTVECKDAGEDQWYDCTADY